MGSRRLEGGIGPVSSPGLNCSLLGGWCFLLLEPWLRKAPNTERHHSLGAGGWINPPLFTASEEMPPGGLGPGNWVAAMSRMAITGKRSAAERALGAEVCCRAVAGYSLHCALKFAPVVLRFWREPFRPPSCHLLTSPPGPPFPLLPGPACVFFQHTSDSEGSPGGPRHPRPGAAQGAPRIFVIRRKPGFDERQKPKRQNPEKS